MPVRASRLVHAITPFEERLAETFSDEVRPFSEEFWPHPEPQAGLCWWVLRTRSRQEKVVAETLESHGHFHFLPLISAERFHGRRRVRVDLPLFPGYVFLFGEREATYQIDRTKRIAGILPVDDQERLRRELWSIRQAISLDADFDPYPYLPHGVRAEVTSGPYKGVQGFVDRDAAPNKLILQVDLLQSAMAIEIDGAMLAPM